MTAQTETPQQPEPDASDDAAAAKPTAAQLRVLALLDGDGPMDAFGMTVHRVREDMLYRMQAAGLVRFRPFGKPPSWALTPEGRKIARRAE